MPVTEKIKRQVLTACGNECAVPDCDEPIFELDHETIVGDICHIRGARPTSARHVSNLSDEIRHGFDNLIVLCVKHHVLIDDNEDRYPAGLLIEWKKEHEQKVIRRRDRNWICWPNAMTLMDKDGSHLTVRFWVDRNGRPQIYSKEQLAICYELTEMFELVRKMQTFLEVIEQLSDASQIEWAKIQARKINTSENEFIERFYEILAIAQDVTFGEYRLFGIKGGLSKSKRDESVAYGRKLLANMVAKLPENPTIRLPD